MVNPPLNMIEGLHSKSDQDLAYKQGHLMVKVKVSDMLVVRGWQSKLGAQASGGNDERNRGCSI